MNKLRDIEIEVYKHCFLPTKVEISAKVVEDTDNDHQLAITLVDKRNNEEMPDWYEISFNCDWIEEKTLIWLAGVLARDLLDIVQNSQANIKEHFKNKVIEAGNIIGVNIERLL